MTETITTRNLIFKDIPQLERLQLIESNLLSCDPSYPSWEKRCLEIYQEAVEQHGLEFRPYQYKSAAMYCLRRNNLCTATMGWGKEQPVSSIVYTPYGPKRMGDIKVGDEVLSGKGHATLVTDVYPQGRKAIYKVTFSDGSVTHCGEEHLWATRSPHEEAANKPYSVKPLREIMQNLKSPNGLGLHYIPLTEGAQFEERALPIHPYVLGYILGNGSTKSCSPSISTADERVVEYISELLPAGLRLRKGREYGGRIRYDYAITAGSGSGRGANQITTALKGLGLWGLGSPEKFIPEVYLYNSIENRLALLRGLMDSDGYCVDKCTTESSTHLEFCSTSKRLADGVTWLVQSLGGTVTHGEKEKPGYSHNGEDRVGKKAYRVYPKMPGDINPFWASKSEIYRSASKYSCIRYIDAVEKVGEEDCQCISVLDDSHLYLTDEFIVTHNTLVTAVAIAAVYPDLADSFPGRVHIVVPNGLAAARWIEDLNRVESLSSSYEYIHKTSQLLSTTKPILIYNQRLVLNNMPRRAGVRTKSAGKYLAKYLKPNWLIVDESHEVGETSKQGALLKVIRRRAKRYMELSGTLSDGSIKSVFVALKRIYRDALPYNSYQEMKDQFASSQRLKTNYLTGSISTGREKWLEGLNPDRIADFYQAMRRYMHRSRLSDPEVAQYIKIPEEKIFYHKLVPTREMQLEYIRLVRSQEAQMRAIAEGDDTAANRAASLRLLNPLIRLVNSPTQGITSAKLERLKEIIRNAEGKVGIFVDRRLSGEYLATELAEWNPAYLSSELTPEQRLEVLQQFQLDPNHKVTILSSNLAAASIDLTAGTDTVFYCLSWKFRQIRQAGGRMVRPGNKHPSVNIHYLSHIGLVDEHQCALAESRTVQSRLVNDFEILEDEEGTRVDPEPELSTLNALNLVLGRLSVPAQ